MNLLNKSKCIATIFCALLLLPQNYFTDCVSAMENNIIKCNSVAPSENKVLSKNIMKTYDTDIENKNSFFSLTSRIRYTDRWILLQNLEKKEDLADHSLEVGVIAHALALIKNKKFNGNVNAERAALLGIYHDMLEIVTGDLPTPVKYYDENLKCLYEKIEDKAADEMISLLPEEFRGDYSSLLKPIKEEEELWGIVKSADTISAMIKCLREKRVGNNDFDKVYVSYCERVLEMAAKAPEVDYFVKTFMPSFGFKYQTNMQSTDNISTQPS